ncbi:MAG: shikimate kinase [Bacteroidota bacterium]|nr:shikimate kinase [Bacteroidota bacterium]
MNRRTKIFLIGFMGSGKSTTGRKLASCLSWSFIDLDKRIEEKAGMKIPDIFSERGESWFRGIESEALRNVNSETKTVISTGGGTPCFGNNMEFMLENGLTIYLRLTPEQLEKRLGGSSTIRPLLTDVNRDDLGKYIQNKLGERERWYQRADITVDGYETDIPGLCSLVRKWI